LWRDILPGLVEKDYWIKHVLYSMTKLELEFELKGGTSLSKAFRSLTAFRRTSIFTLNLLLLSESMKIRTTKM
jgi:predicted nucleotidyltransferase component of viral defense system